MKLLPDLKIAENISFLQTKEARQAGSSYRLILESAIMRFDNIEETDDIAHIFLAAIALGG